MAVRGIVYSLRPAQRCLTFVYFFNPKQCTHRVLRKTDLKPVICITISEYHLTPALVLSQRVVSYPDGQCSLTMNCILGEVVAFFSK